MTPDETALATYRGTWAYGDGRDDAREECSCGDKATVTFHDERLCADCADMLEQADFLRRCRSAGIGLLVLPSFPLLAGLWLAGVFP